MYNIIEEDAVGTLREHLVHMDLLAGTMCGIMDTSDWPRVVKQRFDLGLGFDYHKTLKCRECAQNEPLNKPPPHKWLRDGGQYSPFTRAQWISNLYSRGVDTSGPEYARLTPSELLRITEEVRNGAFRWPEAQVSPSIQNIPFSDSVAVPPGMMRFDGPISNDYLSSYYAGRRYGVRPDVVQACPICERGRLYRSDVRPVYKCHTCSVELADSWVATYAASGRTYRTSMVRELQNALTPPRLIPETPPPARPNIEEQERARLAVDGDLYRAYRFTRT